MTRLDVVKVRKVHRQGLFHQGLETQFLKFPCLALVGEDDVGHVARSWGRTASSGSGRGLGAGHPVAVQGIFRASEPVELLVGI